jgi:hypothetical protein
VVVKWDVMSFLLIAQAKHLYWYGWEESEDEILDDVIEVVKYAVHCGFFHVFSSLEGA